MILIHIAGREGERQSKEMFVPIRVAALSLEGKRRRGRGRRKRKEKGGVVNYFVNGRVVIGDRRKPFTT